MKQHYQMEKQPLPDVWSDEELEYEYKYQNYMMYPCTNFIDDEEDDKARFIWNCCD